VGFSHNDIFDSRMIFKPFLLSLAAFPSSSAAAAAAFSQHFSRFQNRWKKRISQMLNVAWSVVMQYNLHSVPRNLTVMLCPELIFYSIKGDFFRLLY
jgi:hypothetical protein